MHPISFRFPYECHSVNLDTAAFPRLHPLLHHVEVDSGLGVLPFLPRLI